MNDVIKEIDKSDIGKIEKDVFLSKYTTYRVGGMARCIVYPKTTNKLVKLIKILRKHNVKFQVLGNGSNLLFSDKIYDGVLIKLSCFDNVKFYDKKLK